MNKAEFWIEFDKTRDIKGAHYALHRQYYGQCVNPGVIAYVVRAIGADAILRSADPHFNDIPLKLWDAMHGAIRDMCGGKMSRLNGAAGYSLSDSVRIAKEAARQYQEAHRAE